MSRSDVIMGVVITNFFLKCVQRVILSVCKVSLSFHIWFLSLPQQGFERQKSPGVIGLKVKVLLFWLHSIAIYFADIQFSNKEPVRTQVLTFSRFNSQTPTSSSSWGCNLDKDYSRYTKWGPDLIFQVLPCIATFKLG